MGRRNLDRYTDDDWRAASRTLEQILANGWPVIAECDLCGVRLRADVEAIAWRAGMKASLWGAKPRCRAVGCPGRVTFWIRPRGAIMAIAMTAAPRR